MEEPKKIFVVGAAGSLWSGLSWLVSLLPDITPVLQFGVLLTGFGGGLVCTWYAVKLGRAKLLHEEALMCSDCRQSGHPLKYCPVPRDRRPTDCPYQH